MKMNVSDYFTYNSSQIFNSIVIAPYTVSLHACTIDVNEELKLQGFATNGTMTQTTTLLCNHNL